MSKLDDFKATAAVATQELLTIINQAADVLVGTPASADGTQVTVSSGGHLIDAGGHDWSFGEDDPANVGCKKCLKDGEQAYGGSAVMMTIKAGVIYVRDVDQWWKDTGSSWVLSSDPF